MNTIKFFGYALLGVFLSLSSAHAQPPELTVYSGRHYPVDQALYDTFFKETGIKVTVLQGEGAPLLERLRIEGRDSPADLFIAVDAGMLWRARQQGLLQPVRSDILEEAVPSALRDPDGYWFALAKRARVIIYRKAGGRPENLKNYEDLADPALKGRLCMRSSGNAYNQSLLASLIAANGEEKALAWVRGIVANFARTPQGNDEANIKDVATGVCGLSVVNSYYLAKMMDNAKEKQWAEKVAVIFPNQSSRGAHINISGAGITAHSRNHKHAVKFLEYLVRKDAQALFANANSEYPVTAGVPLTPALQALGTFKEDALSASELGTLNITAVKLADQGGWR